MEISYKTNETAKDLLFNEYAFDSSQVDTFDGKIGIKDYSITNSKIAENAQIAQSKIAGLSTTYASITQGNKADTAYQKPPLGIPAKDLDTNVQSNLVKASTALQPSTLYAASSVTGGSALAANKLNNAVTIQVNGKDIGTFDGSSAKSINITNTQIGLGTAAFTSSDDYLKKTEVPVSTISNIQTQQTANTAAIANLTKNNAEGSWGEIDTGRTFRGKVIYRQDFTLYINASANQVADLTLISTANYIDSIVSVGGFWDIGYQTERWCLPSAADGTNYAYVLLFGANNVLTFRSKANNNRSSATAIIIVEYTCKNK